LLDPYAGAPRFVLQSNLQCYIIPEMNTIQEALKQVRELQQKILEKQRFKGYSGRARAISGTLALAASAIMSSHYWPDTEFAHLAGWSIVFVLSVILNFGAILYWFLADTRAKRDFRRLKPLTDVLPPLIVGAILTFALISNGLYSWLFPVWMVLFGLANLATRHVLPKAISLIGWFYIIAGSLLLLSGVSNFQNPWPMGIIFFAGEWMGGFVLHYDENPSIVSFFRGREKFHAETR
jgi:hypothetical protein